MNLNEINEILKKRLKCPDKRAKTIINMLDIVKHKGKRAKADLVEIIERDSEK